MDPVQDTCMVLILTTTPRDSGEEIARALINEHLAACVNIMEIRSLFRWEGEMNHEEEELLIIKTRKERSGDAIERIRQLHSYELPEIIVLPVSGAFAPYLQWIGKETEE